MEELKCPMEMPDFHRKNWEHTQIIYSLKRLSLLTPDSLCLAIGAGREHLLYYLTYKVKNVHGIDLYEGEYYGGEDEEDIPVSAERYAPFPFIKEKLHLSRMNALELDFQDNYFDFLFSASSIEHFGTKKDILQSLNEMRRVLKPGGVVSLTTELKLNRRGTRFPNVNPFFFNELLEMCEKAGFLPSENFDLRIEEEHLRNWVKLPEEIYKRPHVILRFFNTVYTSIHLILRKEGNDALTGKEVFPEIPDFHYKSEISVIPNKAQYPKNEPVELEIKLENNGNFKWINTGNSHRIALGVQLFYPDNQLINRDFATIVLPDEVLPGKTLRFPATIKTPEEKGKWIMKFELKKELVFWFSEKGDTATDVKIEVL
jgi:SAM-dependent methyltransferase